jgi:hypothetical protein
MFQPPSSNRHPITYFVLVPLIHFTLFINNFFWASELNLLNYNDSLLPNISSLPNPNLPATIKSLFSSEKSGIYESLEYKKLLKLTPLNWI